MSVFEIRLLHGFSVVGKQGNISKFRSDKARALLAYVATESQQAHSRNALAALLWPDADSSSSKANLRMVLSNLRHLLPDALTITRSDVQLNRNLVAVDVATFAEQISAENLSAALELYQGEFLEGFDVRDALGFSEWATLTREALHVKAMSAYDRLLDQRATEQQWDHVLSLANNQLKITPWHEPAFRHLIQACAAKGDLPAAKTAYERCQTTLNDELGIEPSAKTQALFEQIVSTESVAVVRHNLPVNLASFRGREADIECIQQAIVDNRLVTIQGMGGIGKSRVAVVGVEPLIGRFEDGVWLIPLVSVEVGDDVPQRLAMTTMTALGMYLVGTQPPLEQLLNRLQGQRRLLVLDNVEQLGIEVHDFIVALLDQTMCHLLVTSRSRLQLPNEIVITLGGLMTDAATMLFHDRARVTIEDEAAVIDICNCVEGLPLGIELAAAWTEHFTATEIADALRANLSLADAGDKPERHRSLRAAFDYSWRLLSRYERVILAELSVFRGSFGREALLTVTSASMSELSSLIASSLVQSPEVGRYTLHEIVREFASEKLEQSAEILARFCTYYLTQVNQRYEQHLALNPVIIQSTRREHANIGLAWRVAVDSLQANLIEASWNALALYYEQAAAYDTAASQIDYARAQAVAMPDIRIYLDYWKIRLMSQWADLEGALPHINALLDSVTPDSHPILFGKLTLVHGKLLYQLGRYDAAERELLESIAYSEKKQHWRTQAGAAHAMAGMGIFHQRVDEVEKWSAMALQRYEQSGDAKGRLQMMIYEAIRLCMQADYEPAIPLYQTVLDEGTRLQQSVLVATAASNLGIALGHLGQPDRAEVALSLALQAYRKHSDRRGESVVLVNLAELNLERGTYAAAESFAKQSLALTRRIGNRYTTCYGLMRLGIALLEQGRGSDARPMFEELLADFDQPEHAERIDVAHVGLALLDATAGEQDGALNRIETILPNLIAEAKAPVWDTVWKQLRVSQLLRTVRPETAQRLQVCAMRSLKQIVAQHSDPQLAEKLPLYRTVLESADS